MRTTVGMGFRGALVLLGAALALGQARQARARGSDQLLGWSADRTWFLARNDPGQREDGSVPFKVCATSDADSATFPSWVRAAIPVGELCFDSDDVGLPALRQLVPRVRKARAGGGPLGLKVKLTTSDEGNTVIATFTRGKARDTAQRAFYGDGPARLRKVYWSPDGSAAIVEVADREGSLDWFGFGLRALVPSKSAGDPALAGALNLEGLARYREGDYHAARVAFAHAAAVDPTLPAAHYNLAAMSAIFGDAAVALRELGWLAASKDARSKVFLDKVPRDGDFARLAVDPAFRTLVGLPVLQPSESPMGRLLLSVGGVWSLPAATCERPTVVLAFTKDGLTATLRSCPAYDGTKLETVVGTWTPSPTTATAEIALPGLGKGKQPISFERCPGSTVDAGCLRLGARPGLGPFHRGVAPDPAEVATRPAAPTD
ncbi:MAG: hypothetical protein IT370_35995 [Deltaproteobacteria bacterium]|nr:hypothetical protein [Deltaproteobacteria bacterium]